MIDFANSQPMHYWAMPAFYTAAQRKMWLDRAVSSGEYLYSLKTDGNWSRAIITPQSAILQTRGISKKTGTYGEIHDRVLWWDSVKNAFRDTTVILGEVYLEGGVDRDVGSILRCLPQKSRARQFGSNIVKWRIFDVLCYEGEDISQLPIEKRSEYIPLCLQKINDDRVCAVEYKAADESIYDELNKLFLAGEEGVVMYKRNAPYVPGSRTAQMTCKIKKELEQEVDAVCTGFVPPQVQYKGDNKDWLYEIDGVKVTKNYYYGWPGAISCSFYKNGQLVHFCDVSGIDDDTKEMISKHPEYYIGKPVKLSAMQITPDCSLRHPRFCGFREDINPNDCTYEKVMGL